MYDEPLSRTKFLNIYIIDKRNNVSIIFQSDFNIILRILCIII